MNNIEEMTICGRKIKLTGSLSKVYGTLFFVKFLGNCTVFIWLLNTACGTLSLLLSLLFLYRHRKDYAAVYLDDSDATVDLYISSFCNKIISFGIIYIILVFLIQTLGN